MHDPIINEGGALRYIETHPALKSIQNLHEAKPADTSAFFREFFTFQRMNQVFLRL
jgi:hypothetical protein